LAKLFKYSFQLNLKEKQECLFFSNILCYKEKGSTGNINNKWFNNSSITFYNKLIGLIQPQIIITLDKEALRGLSHCGKLCYDDDQEFKISDPLTNIVKH